MLLVISVSLTALGVPITVRVAEGKVRGVLDAASGVGKWLGVPYAAPPVGNLRWMPPALGRGWEGVRGAKEFPPDCPQIPDYTSFFPGEQSEDCLYANIWAPTVVEGAALRPVMVFIHGGSFVAGSGSGNDWLGDPLYQGNSIGSGGCVLVTFNYRLGVFGFLGGVAVSEGTPDGSRGNFGLQDTVALLRWVKRNIRSFGGDPLRVTVFGESSGASLVGTLLVMNGSEGLFRNAGLESGSYDNATIQLSPDVVYGSLLHSSRCGNLTCLRSRSTREILSASRPATQEGLWGPVVDGVVLTLPPERLAAASLYHPNIKSVIIGTNANEGRLLINTDWAEVRTGEQYFSWLRTCGYFPADRAADIFHMYPCGEGGLGCWESACEVWTDSQFACPARRAARTLVEPGRRDVYMYYLGFSSPIYSAFLAVASGLRPRLAGVPHGAELPFVFNDTTWLTTPTGRHITSQFATYYRNTAAHSSPNYDLPPGTPPWPPYNPQTSPALFISNNTHSYPRLKQRVCNFWDTVVLPMTP